MNNLEKFISKIIEKYLEDNILDIEIFESEEDLINFIDSKKLSKEISDQMSEMILEFQPVPMLDTSHSYICPKCYRSFGTWKSKAGTTINDSVILSNNKKILIIDDLN